MVAPTLRSRTSLTGEIRSRPGWFGKQILQVELKREFYRLPLADQVLSTAYEWTDATWEDTQVLMDFKLGKPAPAPKEQRQGHIPPYPVPAPAPINWDIKGAYPPMEDEYYRRKT